MSDDQSERTSDAPPKRDSQAPDRKASDDLAEGLELMLRAARKVVRKVDPAKIESAGRRAMHGLESIDAKKVGDFGKRAAKNLDPKKIEEVAGDAGRELLSVIERVADRMEKIVDRAMHEDGTPAPEGEAAGASAEAESSGAAAQEPAEEAQTSTPPRVRIEDG